MLASNTSKSEECATTGCARAYGRHHRQLLHAQEGVGRDDKTVTCVL